MQGLLTAITQDIHQAINSERELRQRDAATPDPNPAAFPLQGTDKISIVRVLRHLIALTGFAAEEVDEIFSQPPGTVAAVLRGEDAHYDFYRIWDLVNTSRAVAVAYPGESVRDWWLEARHNKRLSPLQLFKEGRHRDRIFQAYQDELTGTRTRAVLVMMMGEATFTEIA